MIETLVNQRGQMGRGGGQSILLWVIIVLLVIIIIYLWYSNRKNTSQNQPEDSLDMDKIDVALKLLNPQERQVVNALIEKGGEMLQKDIHYDLDMTRVQAHRIVQSLSSRDLITVEDHFNTKKVILAEWLLG